MTPALVGLDVGGDVDAWRALGFDVTDGCLDVGGCRIRLDRSDPGVHGWTLTGVDGRASVDGLETRYGPAVATSANVGFTIDHVVVGTPNRDRTIAAFRADLGLEPRRQTDHVLYGRPMVQTFFLLANTIIEMISRPEATGEGPSVFWGLAFTANDLDAVVASAPGLIGDPHDAVQPGRRIATVRGAANVGVPLAFLSPRPRTSAPDAQRP